MKFHRLDLTKNNRLQQLINDGVMEKIMVARAIY